MKICTTKKQSYVQQLTAMSKRAHAWAFVAPLSVVAKHTQVHQRVTHHPAVSF